MPLPESAMDKHALANYLYMYLKYYLRTRDNYPNSEKNQSI